MAYTLIGALAGFFTFSRILFLILWKWRGGLIRIAVVDGLLGVAVVSLNVSKNGFEWDALIYAVPPFICFAFDYVRFKRSGGKDPLIADEEEFSGSR